MNQIMLDLETMGTSADAAIVAIGAVRFNETEITDDFYLAVSLQSSVDLGLVIEPATVLWWMQQSDQARQALTGQNTNIAIALSEFRRWIGDDAIVWGNGSDFDNVILANAYCKIGKKKPWPFWNNRCYRTVKNLHPSVKIKRTGTHHNALVDAKSQALHLIEIFKQTEMGGR